MIYVVVPGTLDVLSINLTSNEVRYVDCIQGTPALDAAFEMMPSDGIGVILLGGDTPSDKCMVLQPCGRYKVAPLASTE